MQRLGMIVEAKSLQRQYQLIAKYADANKRQERNDYSEILMQELHLLGLSTFGLSSHLLSPIVGH